MNNEERVVPREMFKEAERNVQSDPSSNGLYLALQGAIRWLDAELENLKDCEPAIDLPSVWFEGWRAGIEKVRSIFFAPKFDFKPIVHDPGEQKVYRAVQITKDEFNGLFAGQALYWRDPLPHGIETTVTYRPSMLKKFSGLAGYYVGEELLGAKCAAEPGMKGIFIQTSGLTPKFGATAFEPETGCRPNWQVNEDGSVKEPLPEICPSKCPHRWQRKIDESTHERVVYCELCDWVYSRDAILDREGK
ncbi:MAG: hypothetical protein M1423_00700 [Acidobacteria bacterium]|nr:hypothetical protein [Acidobacteriota bacterium]